MRTCGLDGLQLSHGVWEKHEEEGGGRCRRAFGALAFVICGLEQIGPGMETGLRTSAAYRRLGQCQSEGYYYPRPLRLVGEGLAGIFAWAAGADTSLCLGNSLQPNSARTRVHRQLYAITPAGQSAGADGHSKSME